MKHRILFISIGFLFSCAGKSMAQIYGDNTFEFQYGNLPYKKNRNLTTSYDQLNLFYDQNNISLFGRIEQFMTPIRKRNYFDLTQKRVEYQDKQFDIRIGNFYETIGRGLLLRSYEIPGSVYEDDFYRTRYAFYRDLEGVTIDYKNSWMETKVLRGRPLYNIYPPDIKPDSLRRPDLTEAVQSNFYLTQDVSIGGAIMRSHSDGVPGYHDFGDLMFDANLPMQFQLFGEYTFDTKGKFSSFRKKDSYALYTGLNYYHDSFGLSLEYKNYNKFRLGSGYNDPPSLIKEHTYPVLNRSTHVLETSNETGFQFEFYYNFDGGHSITGNYTTATNKVSNTFHYWEYFLEGSYKVNEYLTLKSFADYAQDELKGEKHRFSAGFTTEKNFNYEWNIILDLEYQTFRRSFDPNRAENYYGSLSVTSIPNITVSAVFEASTDVQLTDDPRTAAIETKTRTWLGGNIRYKISQSNTLDVFAGKRRGGPACTSGICYEILDFEGVEVRFSTRF